MAIVLRRGELGDGGARDVCAQPSEGLFAAAADSDEESVTALLAKDAADAREVVEGVFEEDELELAVGVLDVEACHVAGHDLFKLLLVRHLLVPAFRSVALGHEVAEDDVAILEEFFVLDLLFEGFRDELGNVVRDPETVLGRDETVVEDSHGFVNPETEHDESVVAGRWTRHEHALEDLRHVSEVEGVVRLGGGGLEVLSDLCVDV